MRRHTAAIGVAITVLATLLGVAPSQASADGHTGRIIDGPAAAAAAVPTCRDTYPYGCTKKQMWRTARKHRRAWFRHQRFGGQDSLLVGLSKKQKRRARSVLKSEVRANLRADRRRWRKKHAQVEAATTAAVWRATWRGQAYTLRSFPYRRYVRAWTGTLPGGWQGCLTDDKRMSVGTWATHWCRKRHDNRRFVMGYIRSMAPAGRQSDWSCKKEVIITFIGGAFFGGPLTLGARALRAAQAGGSGLVGCIGYQIGRMSEWW